MNRPTADLGEELERHARQMRQDLCEELPNGVGNTIDALLDRLILYREALELIAAFEAKGSGANYYFESVWELVDVARDVLSRSA